MAIFILGSILVFIYNRSILFLSYNWIPQKIIINGGKFETHHVLMFPPFHQTNSSWAGMVGLAPKRVRLTPIETNPGLFQMRFQYIWLGPCSWGWGLRFGTKVGQIGPNWDKSRTFSDEISVHLARSLLVGLRYQIWDQSRSDWYKNVLKPDLK